METSPPMEIIIEILARLPVKDLLRFKCVAKAWRDLISSPHFIKRHLDQSLRSEAEYVSRPDPEQDTKPVPDRVLVLSNLTSLQVVDLKTLNRTQKLEFPCGFSSPESTTLLIGSCHGLICICSSSKWDLSIFNPLTGSYRVLSRVDLPRDSVSVCFGFGFDSRSGDYKVVRIANFFASPDWRRAPLFMREIRVYSLRTDSWRLVSQDESSNYEEINSHGAYVNGRLHWLLIKRREGRKGQILSFDLGEQRFVGEVPTPPYYGSMEHFPKDVGIVNGKLCFLTEANSQGCFHYIDVWMMNEYGLANSWTKLYSLWCLSYPFPLLYDRVSMSVGGRGEVLVTEGGSIFWLETFEQKKTPVAIVGADECTEAVVCMRSLASVW